MLEKKEEEEAVVVVEVVETRDLQEEEVAEVPDNK